MFGCGTGCRFCHNFSKPLSLFGIEEFEDAKQLAA
jgi:pyruvate-formate lyase-activating enzyme